jgi:hypothetical protein
VLIPHPYPRTDASAGASSSVGSASGRRWFWAGLAFLTAAIAFLEAIDPYFFCQDDALVLELPGVLSGMRAMWQGIVPTYCPFIFLGSPTPAIGGIYPPLHVSYGIARHLLGDEYAMFDVFAACHLVVGYCLTFLFARRIGIGPVLAAVAGLTFVLSGPVLVMSRCWHSFAVLAAFIPLFAVLVDFLRTGPVTPRWPMAVGLALGLYYHAGFPQIFVLGCGIMLIHACGLAVMGLLPWRRLAWFVPALAFGAAIAIPVFYQQWRLSREMSIDDPGGGLGLESNLLSLLMPYPLVQGSLPNFWGNINLEWGGHFYYSGTVLLVGFVAAVAEAGRRLVLAKVGSDGRGFVGPAPRVRWALVIPAVVAFLLALGEWGGLWWLMGLLPVGLRNNPFRVLPWFVFFASLAGADFYETLITSREEAGGRPAAERRMRLLAVIAGAALTLTILHLTRVGIAFYAYGFQPYPEMPSELSELLKPADKGRQQRIMTFATMRSTDPSYPLALPHNLPCQYELPAVFGYDPLVQRFGRYNACLERVAANPQAALAAYGVRWLLAHRTSWGGWQPQTPNRFERVLPFVGLLKTLGNNPQVNLGGLDEYLAVIEIPNPAPLAFDEAEPTQALPLRMTLAGLDVEVVPAAAARRLVVNFLRYPDMAATVDGRVAEVTEDEWQRIVVAVPADARRISIRFDPPRFAGNAIAAVLALVGGVAMLACSRVAEKPARDQF